MTGPENDATLPKPRQETPESSRISERLWSLTQRSKGEASSKLTNKHGGEIQGRCYRSLGNSQLI